MSMLSSKCDRLRDRAHELRMFADGLSAPYIVPSTKETMGLSMRSAATELERAADTIWDLRCKLGDLQDEREVLSQRIEHATEMNSMLIGMPEHERRAIASMFTTIDGINLSERIRELEAENAKLREQVVRLQADWESERDYADQMEANEKRAVSDNSKLRGENAKLRELAAEAIRLMQANGPDCGICKHYDECWTGEAMDYSPSGCVICNEARELGIEV